MFIEALRLRPFVILLFFLILIILFQTHFRKTHFSGQIPQSQLIVYGKIFDEPNLNNGKTSFLLETKIIKFQNKKYKTKKIFKVIINSQCDLGLSDLVLLKGDLFLPKRPTNDGQFNMEEHYLHKNILGILTVSSDKDIKLLKKGKGIVTYSISIKNKILWVFREILSREKADLLGSILFGSKASPIDDEIVEQYRRSGVIHILVASGNRIAILIGICFFLQRIFAISKLFTSILASLLIWMFTMMAGFGPSILRASVMGQITLLGVLFEKDTDFYNTLCASAFIILLFDSKLLFDIGFQLSFAATWSFVYLAPVFAKFLKNYCPKILAESISVALAPFVATLPINLYYFSTISFIGVLANMVVVPIAEIITSLGFICSFLVLVSKYIAFIPLMFVSFLITLMSESVKIFSSVHGAFGHFGGINIFHVILFYGLLVYTIENMKKNNCKVSKSSLLQIFSLFIFISIFLSLVSNVFAQKNLEITVLDVGQGDAIFVRLPSKENILIDAGPPKAGKNVVVPFLRKNGINKLDLAVLTHAHDDHVGGFPYVLKTIRTEKVFDPGVPHTSFSYIEFLRLIKDKKIKYFNPRAGQMLYFGKVKMFILAPFDPIDLSDLNNSSIVLRFEYGNTAFLFTGDTGINIENQILAKGFKVKSDVLKVGHHGSRFSTSPYFLKRVNPNIAIISVASYNKYGHPSERVLKLLEDSKIKVYRTDISGSIKLISDGKNVFIKTYK